MTEPKSWNQAREVAKGICRWKRAHQAHDAIRAAGVEGTEEELDAFHAEMKACRTMEDAATVLSVRLGLDVPAERSEGVSGKEVIPMPPADEEPILDADPFNLEDDSADS